ncbi:MAG: neutral/alkaline non-lysosomal ceramidase N-terminal domain-containing protein [Terriglobia bacterium]
MKDIFPYRRNARTLCKLLLGLTFAVLVAPAAGVGAVMKAGVARADITPPPGVHMMGYANSSIPTGTLDPLYARVLVLEAGDRRLAWVDLDLSRPFGPASLDWLRNAVAQATGIHWMIVDSIHTHAGPMIRPEYPSGPPPWEESALRKIVQAVEQAQGSAVPVRLGTAYGRAYIGYNRRRVNADGSVTMIWNNAAKAPTSPVDPTVGVLRIDKMDGTPLAILVNYACHPVTFGPGNTRYSADFPGVMCKLVRQAFGGQPVCFYLQGASGDINVYDASTPIKDGAVQKRDWAGEQLGTEVVRVAKGIHTRAAPDASLDYSDDSMTFGLRWNPDKFRQAMLKDFGPNYLPPIQTRMQLPVTTLLIDKRIAIMGMPGEPFVNFQMEWRTRCPVQDCFFLGYTNGYFGYRPTIKAAAQGGYGAGNETTWVQTGAGEAMVVRALVEVNEMLGRLQDVPRTNW